jgi:hypothetical protein
VVRERLFSMLQMNFRILDVDAYSTVVGLSIDKREKLVVYTKSFDSCSGYTPMEGDIHEVLA